VSRGRQAELGDPVLQACGHRVVSHPAELDIQAWGRNREECLVEALDALVESFADVAAVRATSAVRLELQDGPPEDLLVLLLGEVIARIDGERSVPVDVEAEVGDGIVGVRLTLAPLDDVRIVGPAPKAVSLHRLHFEPDPRGWTCSVVLDR
jgi:SHS2 domain-containing protein